MSYQSPDSSQGPPGGREPPQQSAVTSQHSASMEQPSGDINEAGARGHSGLSETTREAEGLSSVMECANAGKTAERVADSSEVPVAVTPSVPGPSAVLGNVAQAQEGQCGTAPDWSQKGSDVAQSKPPMEAEVSSTGESSKVEEPHHPEPRESEPSQSDLKLEMKTRDINQHPNTETSGQDTVMEPDQSGEDQDKHGAQSGAPVESSVVTGISQPAAAATEPTVSGQMPASKIHDDQTQGANAESSVPDIPLTLGSSEAVSRTTQAPVVTPQLAADGQNNVSKDQLKSTDPQPSTQGQNSEACSSYPPAPDSQSTATSSDDLTAPISQPPAPSPQVSVSSSNSQMNPRPAGIPAPRGLFPPRPVASIPHPSSSPQCQSHPTPSHPPSSDPPPPQSSFDPADKTQTSSSSHLPPSSPPDSQTPPSSQSPGTPPSASKPQTSLFPAQRSNQSPRPKKSFFSIDQLLQRKVSEQSRSVPAPSPASTNDEPPSHAEEDVVAPPHISEPQQQSGTLQETKTDHPVAPTAVQEKPEASPPEAPPVSTQPTSEPSDTEAMEVDPTPAPTQKTIEVPPHYSDGPMDSQQPPSSNDEAETLEKAEPAPAASRAPLAVPSLVSSDSESKDDTGPAFKLPPASLANDDTSGGGQAGLDGESSLSAQQRPVSPVLGFSEDANLSMQMTDRRDGDSQRTSFSAGQYDPNEDSTTAWSALGEDSCSRGDDGASMDGIPVHKPPSPVLAFSEDANITMLTGEDSNAAADSLAVSQSLDNQDSNSMASVTMSETTSQMAPSEGTTQTTPGPPRFTGKKRRGHHFESPLTQAARRRISEGMPLPNLVEFKWPQNNNGEYFFLQEQLSVFLEVTSFKRKYPEVYRKVLDIEQRIFLKDKGLVTEAECDIGLTAVRSVEMKKLMREDYPEKWALFRVAMQEKERLKKLKYKENKAIKDKERREMMKERAALHLATEVEFAEQGMTADRLIEYQWPEDKSGEYYMLQEQVSMFCEVLSFKRKYPDLYRRPLEVDERVFLMEKGMVSEIQCDLGLTAVKSEEVMDLLARDYPEKYKEYTEILRERERQQIRERRKEMEMAIADKAKMQEMVKKAVKAAAEFNSHFNRERRDERKAYLDMQTNMIHYPVNKRKVVPAEATKTGAYPVALIPGQYQDYYKRFTPQQLKYFPVNSVLYSSPKKFTNIYVDPSAPADTETEQSSQADEASQSGSSSSSESEESSSESEAEPESLPSETPVSSRASTPLLPTPRRPGRPPKTKSTNVLCYLCKEPADKNKIGEAEDLVKCSECSRHGHPSCLELSTEMISVIKTYPWQCMECKTCIECMDPYDEDKMMFCDHCDRGYHTFCVGLRTIPTGRWECQSCRKDEPKSKRARLR